MENMSRACHDISGVRTEFVAIAYEDRIFLAISQLGTLGTLVAVSRTSGGGALSSAPATFAVRTLLGRRDDFALEAYARLLAEKVGAHTARPLLVALALKPGHEASRKELLARALEQRVW